VVEVFPIKRTNPRFSFFAKVEVTLGDRTLVPAQLSELSSCGCYIQALEPIPIGTELLLCICDGWSTCEVRGEVIYMHSANGVGIFGIGVRFGGMATEQRSLIDTWLRELAGKHAAPPGNRLIPPEK
jgi:PilZ domain